MTYTIKTLSDATDQRHADNRDFDAKWAKRDAKENARQAALNAVPSHQEIGVLCVEGYAQYYAYIDGIEVRTACLAGLEAEVSEAKSSGRAVGARSCFLRNGGAV